MQQSIYDSVCVWRTCKHQYSNIPPLYGGSFASSSATQEWYLKPTKAPFLHPTLWFLRLLILLPSLLLHSVSNRSSPGGGGGGGGGGGMTAGWISRPPCHPIEGVVAILSYIMT